MANTFFVLGFKVGFQVLPFHFFTCDRFVKCLFTILKRAAHINDRHFGGFFNHDIWAYWGSTVFHSLVSGDCTRSDSSHKSVSDFVMAGSDGDHVKGAVTEDVQEGFNFSAVSAGGISIRPAALDGVGGDAVEVGMVEW